MQKKSHSLFVVLLMIGMIIGAVCWGAVKNWSHERSVVESKSVSLTAMLEARVEVAYNILTVAKRHMTSDNALIKAVEKDRNVLEGDGTLREKAIANERFTGNASALLSALEAVESVKNDSRDSMYVSQLLLQALIQSQERTAQAEYNQAASDFNDRLDSSFSGKLARFLGTSRSEEFIIE